MLWLIFMHVFFIDEQLKLRRLADAAIDLYGMAAVISRLANNNKHFIERSAYYH